MRISGAGYESLMVIVPMAVIFVMAVIVMGGPMPLLERTDRYLQELVDVAWEWVRAVFA